MGHTALPWTIIPHSYGLEIKNVQIGFHGSTFSNVCTIKTNCNSKEDANLLVTAVNNHQAMKEALADLANYANLVKNEIGDQDTGWYYQLQAAIQKANKALTLANGKE